MKRASHIVFAVSVLFFCFFLFGVTDIGQSLLRGRIPPNATHWELDDIYMGAGLAPWVYGLAPASLFALVGVALLLYSRAKARKVL